MTDDKRFSVVASNFPVSERLLSCRVLEGLQLIGWKDQHIYISVLPDEQVNGTAGPSNPLCTFDQLVASGCIKGLFCFDNIWHAVDSEGVLYSLKKDRVQDDYDDDLFGDSPKYLLHWELQTIRKLIDKGEILACCQINNGIALVVQEDNNVILKVHYLNDQNAQKEVTIHKYNGPLIKRHQGTHITFIDEENVRVDFLRHWLPENSYVSGSVLIITLPETITCSLFLNGHVLKPYFFFSWPFQAVHMAWTSLTLQGGESSRYLVISFVGGSIAALGPYGEHTLHYPLNNVKNVYIFKTNLFSTNFCDCYTTTLSKKCEGAVGFCKIPNSNNILISTRHRALYNFNPAINKEVKKFKMPHLSIFDQLLQSAEYLEQLSEDIGCHDRYINAMAYSANCQNFKFYISVQTVSIAGNLHTFRVLIETETPGIKFPATVWHLALSVSSSDINESLVQELQSDFSKEKPLEQLCNVSIHGNDRFLEIDASLTSFLSAGKYRPTIYIGKRNLNITYFLQSVSTIPFHRLHLSKNVSIKDFLNSLKSKENTDSKEHQEEQNQSFCTVRVPIKKSKLKSEILIQLVNNSKSLWRAAEWDSVGTANLLELAVGGKIASVELKDSFIEIKCNEIHICYQLKLAIIQLLSLNLKVEGNETVLMEVENILKTLEILEYQKDEIDVQLLKKLFIRKNTLISDKVFQVETKFSTIQKKKHD
ncbi:uncharacterized protein LOC106668650 isoform X2 [Cimex lectularius]|uniref:Uncharacterized protein n=1 Tax=Cimex lectularius TaxID=79782 RepID=A0A8I6RY99_CIMLE|nr:uncharacterized protein LOC106668650 isoform X2 [Cimex lectularius]